MKTFLTKKKIQLLLTAGIAMKTFTMASFMFFLASR